MLETCSRVGGHTGASSRRGRTRRRDALRFRHAARPLVWDVGHQAYAHKILTGRRDELHTIKQYGGLSGFLRRDESEYDTFGAGHASTSLSAALGMAVARDKKKEDFHVCALIGDSSLAGGMAMEAINQAGHLKSRLIVLLNDNEMSIAPAVGALTRYLNRIKEAQSYHRLKEEIGDTLEAVPVSDTVCGARRKPSKTRLRRRFCPARSSTNSALNTSVMLTVTTFRCSSARSKKRKIDDGPVIVHALTTKGKGFPNPEKNYYAYHATGPFDLKTGIAPKSSKRRRADLHGSFRHDDVRTDGTDESIVALTAAMPDGTGD
jgi:1-deoxy-D-xylulose-5-phosphate synthase